MNQMSEEDDLFHNEYTYQRQDGNQRSSDTISIRTGPVGNPSETEYVVLNKIFHTRCATFSEPLIVLRKLNILYENSSPRASVFASGNRLAFGELESCQLPQWYTLTVYYQRHHPNSNYEPIEIHFKTAINQRK